MARKALKKSKRRTCRIGKTNRVPKTRCGGRWTEAAYWAFVRSLLRQGSQRWQPVHDTLDRAKRPNQSSNRRLKWEYRCDECQRWHPRKEVQVDHIDAGGSLRSLDDLPRFVERLFCEADQLQVMCLTCHATKTKEERHARQTPRQ